MRTADDVQATASGLLLAKSVTAARGSRLDLPRLPH